MELVIGHSPDPDDAYMFYALKSGKVPFRHVVREFLADIETLNRLAIHGRIHVTAVSTHAMAYACGRYAILRVGASMGYRYGPVLVGRGGEVRLVAIPGRYATATLLLRLAMPNVETVEIPFDKIIDAVRVGLVDAGVLIHEGQITYGRFGLRKIMDLGEWWYQQTRLPTPLGLDVVRLDLGPEVAREVKEALLQSIRYASEHRDEALRYAMEFARGLSLEDTARFVDMYVNKYSIDMGGEGEVAIVKLLKMASEEGITPQCEPTFI